MPTTTDSSSISTSGVWEITVALLIVIGAIVFLGWVVRKLQPGSIGGNRHLNIISTMAVGTRERVVLIDVAGKQLLIGVTANQISALTELDEPVSSSGEPSTHDFATKLRHMMQASKPA